MPAWRVAAGVVMFLPLSAMLLAVMLARRRIWVGDAVGAC